MWLNEIITGDCRKILPTLPDESFALAFADPPYWVGFDYGDKTDREMEYIEPNWLVKELCRLASVVLITPGNGKQDLYPKPDWTFAWLKKNSMKRYNFGFSCWEPILAYGCLTIQGSKQKPDFYEVATVPQKDAAFHKCPKPYKLLTRLIEQFTNPGDIILDPVSGSGTTCKAAYQLGRNYLGIEIDPKIAELSRERLALSQPPLHGCLTSVCTATAQARLLP